MNTPDARDVLVAVDEDNAPAALDFAVREAARLGCGIHLLHVVRPIAQGPEMPLLGSVDLESHGHRILEAVAERARDVAPPDMSVRTELRIGGVVACIVEAAESRAQLVVMQHRNLSGVWRAVTRSVTSGVAAHCTVPVVSVPSGWARADANGSTITVGVDVPERAHEVLRLGIAAARGRGATLRLLHVWSFPPVGDDALIPELEAEWNSRSTREIERALSATGEDLTGVHIQVDVHRGRAADALVEATRQSELVVLGRHDPVVPIGSHLGPVARAVLRDAEGPVLLADPRPSRVWRHGHHEDHVGSSRARP